jgi:CheY-like chemotaxis protein
MATILAIDDDPLICEVIELFLNQQGFSTITARNGAIGLQLAQEKLPDLIICDVEMPELNGYEVLRVLREDPTTFDIPFIFLTGNVHRNSQEQGMTLGAHEYLTKPFRRYELLKVISSYLIGSN